MAKNNIDIRILTTLSAMGEATGWELWSDDENGVALQLGYLPQIGTQYNSFKRAMARLDQEDMIHQVAEETNRMHKAVWSITKKGDEAWKLTYRRRAAESEMDPKTAEDYVGKRHRAEDGSIPRAVWKELLKRHSDGELDIAFLPHKPRA